jgi:hypothetical protein
VDSRSPAQWFYETVGQMLARRAVATQDAPAIHWWDDEGLVTWTYAELQTRGERGKRNLRDGRPENARKPS